MPHPPVKPRSTVTAAPTSNEFTEPIALYVHIPFCLSKCNYCDFNTYEGIEALMPSFVEALVTEIELWGRRLGRPDVSSIFFGGGTPSYLPTDSVTRILDRIESATMIGPDAEITLEANPDDVHLEKVVGWRHAGFNRISIGVQSFNSDLLTALSRRHTNDDAESAVHTAREGGFSNVSIDLMFGLPNQSLETWKQTLGRAIALGTEHLSLYGLQIETGTPLHRDVELGAVPTPDDDLAADMFENAMDALDAAGYEHYEISNWALPGYRSKHNLAYWLNRPYLGVGPGAHSSLMGKRFSNMKSPRGYIRTMSDPIDSGSASIDVGELAIDFVETTSPSMAISETMMLGLRLSEGVSKSDFQARFETPMETIYGPEIDDLNAAGMIEERDGAICLTRRGKLLGNEVFERFIINDDDLIPEVGE